MTASRPTTLHSPTWPYWLFGLVACVASGWSLGRGSIRLVEVLLVVGVVTVIVLIDARFIAGGQRPLAGIVGLFAILPFSRLLLPGDKYFLVWQGMSCGLLVLYALLLPGKETGEALHRIKAAIAPMGLFMGVLALSYVLSPEMGRADVYFLMNMWSAMAYAGLAAVFCRSPRDTEDFITIIVLCGLLQFPVVVAQAMGWADSLPGPFSQLSGRAWGGSLNEVTGSPRYPGSFGDYELLAEYLAILVLLSLGVILYSPHSLRRLLMFFALVALLSMGWFTGTRAFVLGSVGGGLMIVSLGMRARRERGSRILRIIVFLAGLMVAVLVVVPDLVRTELLSRLVSVEITGPNAFNRGGMFSTWVSLAQRMPPFGYGTSMLEMARTAFPAFLIQSPHSLYFSMLLTAGYPGLVAAGILVLSLVGMCAKCAFGADMPSTRGWTGVLLAVALFWGVDEIKIEFLRSYSYTDFLFALFGMMSALCALAGQEAKASTAKWKRTGKGSRPAVWLRYLVNREHNRQ